MAFQLYVFDISNDDDLRLFELDIIIKLLGLKCIEKACIDENCIDNQETIPYFLYKADPIPRFKGASLLKAVINVLIKLSLSSFNQIVEKVFSLFEKYETL
jgi:hypothetical protein